MIFLKNIFYLILIFIDSFILLVLQFINPEYGINSSDDMMKLMGIAEEMEQIKERIEDLKSKDPSEEEIDKIREEYTERLNETSSLKEASKIFIDFTSEFSDKLKKEYLDELEKLNIRTSELLVQMHTALFNIVLNG